MKTAMVTGAARGIGRATAHALAEVGYDVILGDIDPTVAEDVAEEVAERGQGSLVVEMDVSEASAIDSAVDEALDTFGAIDLLVNNAGIQTDHSVLELPESEWDRVLDVNLKGTFLTAQRIANEMIDRDVQGRIVNVTSVHQSLPRRNKAHYDASKAGIWMLTRDMALELADHGIAINAVAPGAVKTPMNRELLNSDEDREAVTELIPWERWASPEEIADVIRYLGDGAPEYVTGTYLRVDGGLSLAGVG